MKNKLSIFQRFYNANEWNKYFIICAIMFVFFAVCFYSIVPHPLLSVSRFVFICAITALITGYVFWYPLYLRKQSGEFFEGLKILKKEFESAVTEAELNNVRNKIIDLHDKKGRGITDSSYIETAQLISEINAKIKYKFGASKLIEKAKSSESMKALHITSSTNGYEEVELVANRVSKKNQLAVYKKDDKVFMTGGIIINDTPEIRAVLDAMPRNKQYEFVKAFKIDPFVKFYLEEEY